MKESIELVPLNDSKKSVDRFLIIGDSLSDKGTMAHSILAPLSGLRGNSPDGRFTNGYIWADFFCERVLLDSMLTSVTYDPTDTKLLFEHNDDQRVATSSSQDYVRTYCEGGLTAHNYFERVSLNIELDVTEKVLATLDGMRDKIEKDDRAMV